MLIIGVVLLTVVLALVGAFVSYTGSVRKATNVFSARSTAREAAQAGIEKALWCLNQPSGANCGGAFGNSYTGEAGVSIGNSAYYTTSIATYGLNLKTVTAIGYFPSVAKPISTVTLKADLSTDTEQASFHYGVQAGNGGFIFGNNAYVVGNIYANGNVIGSNGAYVTGDVIVAGGTSLTPEQQQLTNNADYEFGRVSPLLDPAQSFQLTADNVLTKLSFWVRKVSTPADATVRILADNNGVPSKTVLATGTLSASLVTGSYGWIDVSFATPPPMLGGTTYWWAIDTAANSTKYWQIGSQLLGGYPDGDGMISASWNAALPIWVPALRDFDFKVWTGGNTTGISNTHVMGTARANTLTGDTIDHDAYYKNKTSTTVGGTSYPNSADPGPQDMPISDAQIQSFRDDGAAGGTVAGDVNYSNGATVTLGPKKITGNLSVSNNSHLTLSGTLYVQGNLDLSNNGYINLVSGYGANSGVIVVDGTVNIGNNTTFAGSGTAGSYILVLTTDDTASAMTLSNNGSAAIFYAANGTANIANNASLKQVTAFTLNMSNNSSVIYESGLANVGFSSGPGASWVFRTGTLREIH